MSSSAAVVIGVPALLEEVIVATGDSVVPSLVLALDVQLRVLRSSFAEAVE